jgi:hypothetical protein
MGFALHRKVTRDFDTTNFNGAWAAADNIAAVNLAGLYADTHKLVPLCGDVPMFASVECDARRHMDTMQSTIEPTIPI